MSQRKPRVLLIGGLPRPSGGVTVFLGRLVNQIGHDVDFHVLDIHAGEKEPTLAKTLKVAPRNPWLRALWMVWKICTFRGDIVHFNYSGCHALVALALLPKLGRRFFVTLHNGSQISILEKLPDWKISLVQRGAKKINIAFSLCDDHAQLYRRLQVEEDRLIHTKSQIPAGNVEPSFVDERHANLRKRFKHLVISSGHVNRTYNFEFLVRYVNEHADCAGMLFFYGEHIDEVYLAELRALMRDQERFAIYFHQSEATFLGAMATSDAYLRPTHVDSWGIAVADAVAMGIPAVASDVCERASGSIKCISVDYISFARILNSELKRKNHKNMASEKFASAAIEIKNQIFRGIS